MGYADINKELCSLLRGEDPQPQDPSEPRVQVADGLPYSAAERGFLSGLLACFACFFCLCFLYLFLLFFQFLNSFCKAVLVLHTQRYSPAFAFYYGTPLTFIFLLWLLVHGIFTKCASFSLLTARPDFRQPRFMQAFFCVWRPKCGLKEK